MKQAIGISVVVLLLGIRGWAQNADVAAKLGFPQMIVYNGKIVTVDDASFESRVGTIVQAMAIRDGKIIATGSDSEIRPMAGSQTRSIDLKGRTVLPTFSMTHEHPTDWAWLAPYATNHAFADNPDEVAIFRWMPNLPPREQLAQFEPILKEALAKAKPGQWIHIGFNYGPNYEWFSAVQDVLFDSIKKEYLDVLAPNNPVKVEGTLVWSVINQKAIDELRKVYPDLGVLDGATMGSRWREEQFLRNGESFCRPCEPDVMFQGKVPQLASVLKAELERWASWGITNFGTAPYTFNNLRAFHYLDNQGEMPARIGWGYIGPNFDVQTLRWLAGMTGHGTDHLWFIGMWPQVGGACMSIPPRAGQEAGSCFHDPGSKYRNVLERMIETGNRIATMHTGGDKDIDNLMDAIEQASQRAGMTLEEIRAMRHTFDHSAGAPRPGQLPRMKNLGMMASLNNTYFWEPGSPATRIAEQYGLEYTGWVAPRKSMTDAGIMSSTEIDRPIPDKVFLLLEKGMSRHHERDQKVYGPGERTDRIIQLKSYTRWGAYYLMRENLLGTLEPGKFADFMVLDRDFLTIPQTEILQIKVLMTVLGGKTVHLVDSLAREVGMQPVGFTTWKEPLPAGW